MPVVKREVYRWSKEAHVPCILLHCFTGYCSLYVKVNQQPITIGFFPQRDLAQAEKGFGSVTCFLENKIQLFILLFLNCLAPIANFNALATLNFPVLRSDKVGYQPAVFFKPAYQCVYSLNFVSFDKKLH